MARWTSVCCGPAASAGGSWLSPCAGTTAKPCFWDIGNGAVLWTKLRTEGRLPSTFLAYLWSLLEAECLPGRCQKGGGVF